MALKQHIDDIAIAAIEECLMKKVADIFTPKTVLDMEDEVIDDIASETEESKLERASSTKKLEILEAALQALRRLDKHKPKGADKTTYSLPGPKLTEPTQILPPVESAPPPVIEPTVWSLMGSTSLADFDEQMASTLQNAELHFGPEVAQSGNELVALQDKLQETGGLTSKTWEGLVAQLELTRLCFYRQRSVWKSRGAHFDDEIEDAIQRCEAILRWAIARASVPVRLRRKCQALMGRQREIHIKYLAATLQERNAKHWD